MSVSFLPDLSDTAWQQTRDTLHLYAKLVGAVRAALAPRQKHWWHTPLRVSAAGLTTTPMPLGERVLELTLNLVEHRLVLLTNRGERREIALRAQSAVQMRDALMEQLAELDAAVPIDAREFSSTTVRPYDRAAAARFWQVLPWVDAMLRRLKSEHRGESGPTVLWPHGFDLALLLFSGRRVPGVNPADEESADEQMNFGFAPGDGAIPEPYFYATAFPAPPGFIGSPLLASARWHTQGWNGALLPYSALRTSANPGEHLLEFFRAAREAGFARMK